MKDMQLATSHEKVLFKPMTSGTFYKYIKDPVVLTTGQAEREGYLVEYIDSPNPNHPDHENYISWSPKEVFDRGYNIDSEKTRVFSPAEEYLIKTIKDIDENMPSHRMKWELLSQLSYRQEELERQSVNQGNVPCHNVNY